MATPCSYKNFVFMWGGSYGKEHRCAYLLTPYLASINNLSSASGEEYGQDDEDHVYADGGNNVGLSAARHEDRKTYLGSSQKWELLFSWEEDSGMKGILELYSDGFYGCRRMAGLVYGRL